MEIIYHDMFPFQTSRFCSIKSNPNPKQYRYTRYYNKFNRHKIPYYVNHFWPMKLVGQSTILWWFVAKLLFRVLFYKSNIKNRFRSPFSVCAFADLIFNFPYFSIYQPKLTSSVYKKRNGAFSNKKLFSIKLFSILNYF